jgi:hypothetical protein
MLKRINPKEKFKLIATSDPAIDQDMSPQVDSEQTDDDGKKRKVLKYTKTLNMADLVFKENQKPTIFVCREIANGEKADVLDSHNKFDASSRKLVIEKMYAMNMRVFGLCVKEIEENGASMPVDLDSIPMDAIQEIGSFILYRSSLSGDEKNG